MFGGVNDDDAGQPADQHQVVPADAALEGSTHAAVTDDSALPGYGQAAYDAQTDAVADPAVDAPADDTAEATDDTADAATPASDNPVAAAGEENGDLLGIKQQALQQLSPLVSHLEQTPEERFRTTMMLIQASDNAELIKDAYEAAGQIPEEKVRAQALLDIVNEINYFTQHQDQQ